MNIVLIGYRGTGKSVVGKRLAARMKRTLISLDAEIVKQAGQTIPEIVEKFGWNHFRDLETAEARKLADRDDLVVDCGGGVIERNENIDILRSNARVFWLKAPVGTIVERIGGDNQRPALTAGKTFIEEIAEVLERRTPKYRKAAHVEIDTDQASPENIAETITGLLE